MNDRHDRVAKLLAGVFHDDWNDGSAANYARAAAAHARRRRAVRRTLAATAMAIGMGALVFLATRRGTAPAPDVVALPPAPAARGYELISDDELLAQLRDRPLLVVRKENGTREIVLLEN